MIACSAAEAWWQHSLIEEIWSVFKQVARALWWSYADFPDVALEECYDDVAMSRNDPAQTLTGMSPSMLALGRQPRRIIGD